MNGRHARSEAELADECCVDEGHRTLGKALRASDQAEQAQRRALLARIAARPEPRVNGAAFS